MLKQLIRIADFLDENKKESDANLMDYFITKFASIIKFKHHQWISW